MMPRLYVQSLIHYSLQTTVHCELSAAALILATLAVEWFSHFLYKSLKNNNILS